MKYLLAALVAILYLYQAIEVQQQLFTKIAIGAILLFSSYIYIIKKRASDGLWFWLSVAILCRLILVFFEPNLSDDLYRFYWDGHLTNTGINPFAFTPTEALSQSEFPLVLSPIYGLLNSQDYYSVYPASTQYLFSITAWCSSSVESFSLILKSIFLLFEMGSILLLIKILDKLKKDRWNALWYALNPLIIIELVGNLHFECLMLFFVLAAYYLLLQTRWLMAAIPFSLAVTVKLVPLILIPLLLKSVPWKYLLQAGFLTLFYITLLFLPFWEEGLLLNIWNSIHLYFQNFEFNASVYYVLRWIGFHWKGYNIIGTLGPILAILTVLTIFILALRSKKQSLTNFPSAVLWVGLVYLLFATTIHPWYIALFIAFSCLTNERFILIWSALIWISYSHYWSGLFEERYGWIALEYIILFIAIGIEIKSGNLLKRYA